MKDWQGKRYWLVGASEGLGREVAFSLSRAGAEVIVSARSEDRLKALVEELPGKASYVTVDVADRISVEAAAEEIGDIDGVVYLAGVYWPMSVHEWDTEKAELMGEVNFLGATRVVGSVIKPMLAKNEGHIVLIGSLSGFRGLAGAFAYCSGKAGMMSLAESIQADLHKSPINVQLINPGYIKTRLTDMNDFTMPSLMTAEYAAAEVFDHMNTTRFKKNFPFWFSLLLRSTMFMPDWLHYRIFGAK